MDESISDQLMEITKIMQEADDETKAYFAACFEAARKLGEKGLTMKQVQVVAMMGQQCAVNPELKQMLQYLTSMMQFDPSAEFN
jgi:ABC-type arginine transport system ATPase subunit